MRLSRSPFRWLAAVAALALAPKCLLCVLAYVGIGAATLGSVEMCGAAESGGGFHAMLPWLGMLVGGVALLVYRRRCRRLNLTPLEKSKA